MSSNTCRQRELEYARAPVNPPWNKVGKEEKTYPFLLQTSLPDTMVPKTRLAGDTVIKNVNFLLVTHSDGSKLVGELQTFSHAELVKENTSAHNYLMCELGKYLAGSLGIASKGNINSASQDSWYALAQLPTGYIAFNRTRKGKSHVDLHIMGHHSGQRFFSVTSFADHLAWLATADDGEARRCDCKVCVQEFPGKKRTAAKVKQQVERKKQCTDYGSPTWNGLPDWWTEADHETRLHERKLVAKEGETGVEKEQNSEDENGSENENENWEEDEDEDMKDYQNEGNDNEVEKDEDEGYMG